MSQETYPLSSLFLLTATIAIVMAIYGPALRGRGGPADLAALGAVAVAGGTIGLILGAHHYRRLRGAFMGVIVGGSTAALASPLILTQERPTWQIVLVTVIGSLLLVAIGLGIRWTTRRE